MDDLVNRRSGIPWEPKGWAKPDELPTEAPDKYPAPWMVVERGNGHFDLYDKNRQYLVHVYCWSKEAYDTLKARVASVNAAAVEED